MSIEWHRHEWAEAQRNIQLNTLERDFRSITGDDTMRGSQKMVLYRLALDSSTLRLSDLDFWEGP